MTVELVLTEFEGENDEEDEDDDRWGDELCNRYDQESQFLSTRAEYENIVSTN
ncbi:hypothetical protein J6590_016875 [Homalodisca vitripennis]|nr:hypothetical protein J6590_016875 [Homalodisca vitripennis]